MKGITADNVLEILDMILCLAFDIGGGVLEVPATAIGEFLLEGLVLVIEPSHHEHYQEKTGDLNASSLDASRQKL